MNIFFTKIKPNSVNMIEKKSEITILARLFYFENYKTTLN